MNKHPAFYSVDVFGPLDNGKTGKVGTRVGIDKEGVISALASADTMGTLAIAYDYQGKRINLSELSGVC